MSDIDFTFAVARIRALEVSLLNATVIEQLIACPTEENCLQVLAEKGWGDSDTPLEADAMLNRETEKTWNTMREMGIDMSVFDVLSYPNQFHNLKAAIKETCRKGKHPGIYYEDCEPSGEELEKIIAEKDFSRLPDYMAAAAQEAYETLMHTRDGQLCDVIIDRATLEAIYAAGKKAKAGILKSYAEDTVAVADIKIAVRSQKTAKSLEFMKKAMAECDSLNIDSLARAALNSVDAICEYLSGTAYAGGAEALAESPSAFERWCDNKIIQTIKPQKYNPFSVEPLVAYVLARENEIKTVRIIVSGKRSGLSDDSIRERVREMYV